MKSAIVTILFAALAPLALAQSAAPQKPASRPAAKPAAPKPAARPAARPASKPVAAQPRRLTPEAAKAIEEATPIEEPDPTIKLNEAQLEIAKRVYTGEIPCELGASVRIRPLRRDGFFLVQHRQTRFVMHPVESRTGALRLEDPERGALWLQLGNKSMLMNQKAGQRLADECQNPEQKTFAEELKKNPINLLEPPKPAASAPRQATN